TDDDGFHRPATIFLQALWILQDGPLVALPLPDGFFRDVGFAAVSRANKNPHWWPDNSPRW
ncbi:MAG: hypothetical protein LC777_05500, partial [Actinobacteria bacterium]|nr:hypothetical protein [Actinomycetota bacterium]